jgi:hypothetical protein
MDPLQMVMHGLIHAFARKQAQDQLKSHSVPEPATGQTAPPANPVLSTAQVPPTNAFRRLLGRVKKKKEI